MFFISVRHLGAIVWIVTIPPPPTSPPISSPYIWFYSGAMEESLRMSPANPLSAVADGARCLMYAASRLLALVVVVVVVVVG